VETSNIFFTVLFYLLLNYFVYQLDTIEYYTELSATQPITCTHTRLMQLAKNNISSKN